MIHITYPNQILTVHTFVSALWRVGLKARSLSVGLVGLVCTYCALCAGIGAGIHKDYAAPTPVRLSFLPHMRLIDIIY